MPAWYGVRCGIGPSMSSLAGRLDDHGPLRPAVSAKHKCELEPTPELGPQEVPSRCVDLPTIGSTSNGDRLIASAGTRAIIDEIVARSGTKYALYLTHGAAADPGGTLR